MQIKNRECRVRQPIKMCRTLVSVSFRLNQAPFSQGPVRWSRFPEQNGGLAKIDSGFGYAANFSSVALVA